MEASRSRRTPGQVRDAIVKALEGHRGAANVSQIHEQVEQTLGGSVARSSVRSYLNLGTGSGMFERVGRGQYRLKSRRK